MSMFRAKKLDLGCFINIKIIRDHTKRKVFEKHEPERCVSFFFLCSLFFLSLLVPSPRFACDTQEEENKTSTRLISL